MLTDDDLPLTVTIPVAEWGYLVRRTRYLEAVAVQILRDHERLREWYAPGELAALNLPGLPATAQAIGRRAREERWLWRSHRGTGGRRGRETREYHVVSLPARAFDALIERILALPAPSDTAPLVVPAEPLPPPRRGDAAPSWVLPLLRVIRRQGKLSVAGAVSALSRELPPDAPRPDYAEAEAMLRSLGMVAGE